MRGLRAGLIVGAMVLWARGARAQTVEVPAEVAEGAVPATPGTGAQAMFVLGFFRGTPYNLDHARDILAGTSITPAFDQWCGALPLVDFTNGTNADSLGRAAPTALCLPFLDPASPQMFPCRPLATLPTGTYSTNGGAVMRVRGWFAVRAPGTFTFAWGHDDGMAFDVGTVPVFRYDDGTPPRVDRRVLHFGAAGLYPFQLDWFDSISGALIDWYVAPGEHPDDDFATAGFALFPTGDLYPSGALPCTADCRRCALPTPRCDYAAARCVACLADRDCPVATRCNDGVCAAPATPDAGAAPDAGFPPDADAVDATLDGGLPAPSGAGGCSCAIASTRGTPGGALVGMLALTLALRGRARRRERTLRP